MTSGSKDYNYPEKKDYINQILPDIFYQKVQFKDAYVLKIEKKLTGVVINCLNQLQAKYGEIFQSYKVHLVKNNNTIITEDYYRLGKYEKSYRNKEDHLVSSKDCCDGNGNYPNERNSHYRLHDISFLKRVKSFNDLENLIFITFTEVITKLLSFIMYIKHLDYFKATQNTHDNHIENFIDEFIKIIPLFKKESIFIHSLPYLQPLSEDQYNISKQVWPISNTPTNISNIIYEHGQDELLEIKKIWENLLELNKLEFIESILYDPIHKVILEKSGGCEIETDENGNFNPISHSIMKLIQSYSIELVKSQMINSNTKLLGVKNTEPPVCEYFEFDDSQYYCENFYIFTITEPCFMCAMALVHSRISRIYFHKENNKDGALKTKLKLNNYNLNHNYLIFQVGSN